jgi:hypothetical protein
MQGKVISAYEILDPVCKGTGILFGKIFVFIFAITEHRSQTGHAQFGVCVR